LTFQELGEGVEVFAGAEDEWRGEIMGGVTKVAPLV
jgi:hypothetical protein